MQTIGSSKSLVFAAILFLNFSACADKDHSGEVEARNPRSNDQTVSYLKVVGVNEHDSLNLRLGPDSKAVKLSALPYNADGIIQLSISGNWSHISYQGSQGWAFNKYLRESSIPSTETIETNLVCIGTEPHWKLTTNGNRITLKRFDVEKSYVLDSTLRESANEPGIWSITAVTTEPPYSTMNAIFQNDSQCSDGMSDQKYRFSILADDGSTDTLSGCCR